MPSLRYLNSVLTLLAVLLSLNLWTTWTMTPASEVVSTSQEAHAQGIPNAGAQRKAILDEVTAVKQAVTDLKTTLTNGSVRVKVDSMPAE